jgi:signal transduction histidine kinase
MLDPRASRMAARISRTAARVTRLIGDLLDFTQARLGGGIPVRCAVVDLRPVLLDTVEELRCANPERSITLHVEGDLTGTWDGDRLRQVIDNLTRNAITYSPARTHIALRASATTESISVEVHNEGPAIDPAALPELFLPLRRGADADAKGRSLGLGLFIVDDIVKSHGGSVIVRSTGTEGTTFRVVLPRGLAPQA